MVQITPAQWAQYVSQWAEHPLPLSAAGLSLDQPTYLTIQELQETTQMTPKQEEDVLLPKDETRYLTPHDASMRLAHTFVRFKDKPYYVDMVDGNRLYLHDYDKGNLTVHMNDARLDIVPARLGYFSGGYPIYTLRNPARQQKQGLDPRRLSYWSTAHRSFMPVSIGPNNIASMLKAMRQEFNTNNFDDPAGIIMSPDWAIYSSGKDKSVKMLFHKIHPVAFFIPKEKLFMFAKNGLTVPRRDALAKLLPGDKYAIQEFA